MHFPDPLRVLLLALVFLAIPFSVAASPPAPISRDPDMAQLAARGWSGPLARRSGEVKAVIELADTPTALLFANAQQSGAQPQIAGQLAQRQLAQIERGQQALLAPLSTLGAQVLYRVQRVYNGVAVRVDAKNLLAISQLPGVKAIHPLVPKQRSNTGSVPLIGAPQVWTQTVGASKAIGTGMRIAIIDTGIDYLHTDFGGPGTYPPTITDTTPLSGLVGYFPSSKVAGGYDLVGDDYDADPGSGTYQPVPHPDPNPLDCNGHGTHVAGSAAGYGVKADGSTYTGTYDSTIYNTPGFFRIGPGVAPGAQLYAYRVFGCNGSTDVTDLAIDRAIDPNGDGNPSDHVDVINMSLGSSYGSTYDSSSIAADNATKVGVIVVASAGNSGDATNVTGSPAAADSVISVAAANQPDANLDGIQVIAGPQAVNGTTQPAAFSVAYDWAGEPDVSGAVYYPATNRNGCTDWTGADATNISGKIVLIDWSDNSGTCGGSVSRTGRVTALGGIGAIIVDNSDVFDLSITGSAVIPAVSMPKAIGDLLKANLSGLQVRFSGSLAGSTVYSDPGASDVIADFSSRGPRLGGTLKPDIAAPGVNIFSALVGSGDEGESLNGTSMAAPHVAGAMAILRQLHPGWSVAELKALAMNTATNTVRTAAAADSQTLEPSRIGAGRINVAGAAADNVIAFDSARPSNVSVSFGNVDVQGTATLTRNVTVRNKGTVSATFNLGYAPAATTPGVVYSVSPATITLAAGASATVQVQLHADASQMTHAVLPSLPTSQDGDARNWVPEASGYLTLTPPAAQRSFTANVRGYFENPQIDSGVSATGLFTFTAATSALEYSLRFSEPFTVTMGHIHRGAAGVNGGVLVGITSAGTISMLSGSTTLGASDVALLLKGELYLNFHTDAHGTGEIRGQIVPKTGLRLPVYAAPQPVAALAGTLNNRTQLLTSASVSGTISLAGSGTGTTSDPALVTALELQESSPPIIATSAYTGYSDLRYVGIGSDYPTTNAIASTTLFIGVATFNNWSSLNEQYFEVDFDTNGDGVIDYALFTDQTGTSSDPSDVQFTYLAHLLPDGSVSTIIGEYPINVLDSSEFDTRLYRSNVAVLAVDAADLGLTNTNSAFDYQVYSSYNTIFVSGGIDDASRWLRYNPAKPGFAFTGGEQGLNTYVASSGTSIPYVYNRANFLANRSEGVLLLHHHNASGERAEALPLRFLFTPMIRR